MAVRDYRELSPFLKEITSRLMADNDLCKLLHFNDKNPLGHTNLTDAEKRNLVFGKLIRFIPRIGPQETTQSKIAMLLPSADKDGENKEINRLTIQLFVYTPFNEWIIEGDDLRIFLIMSKIEQLLDGKDIGGIGNMRSLGFDIALTTDEICGYCMEFTIDALS